MRNAIVLMLALSFCSSAFALPPPGTGDEPAVSVPDAGTVIMAAPDAGTAVSDDVPVPVGALDAGAASEAPTGAAEPPVTTPEPATVLVELVVPTTDADTVIGQLLDVAKNGHWTVLGGLLILLLVWGMNQMGLAAKFAPWVSLGTGVAVAIAVGWAQGDLLLDSLKLGLLEGGVAIALWELVAKHFMGSRTPTTEAAPPVA